MKNLTTRIISGIGYTVVAVCCMLFNQYLFAAFSLFMLVVMMVEFYKMCLGPSRYMFSRLLAILAGVILFGLVFAHKAFDLSTRYLALAIIPMLVVMVNSLFVKDKSEFGMFAFIYTAIIYIAAPMALYNVLAFSGGSFNGLLLISFFFIISASDVGAYCFGMALGQKYGRKLCPKISPKKSWIGFWGGVVFAVAAAVILRQVGALDIPLVHCIVLAILMDVIGVFGDLFESQWKRYYDIKDSGTIIPGHGGMLDRFDSTLFAMPLGTVYLAIFNLI